MAANFCQQWIFGKVDRSQTDLASLSEEEYQRIIIFFANFIQTLGEQLKLRQQVIATATVFFKRFYSQNSLKCVDPLLLAPTSIFLASKVEEFGVISNTRLINTCSTVIKNQIQEICKHIIGLYELWRGFDEKEMCSILGKMPKPKLQLPPQQQDS